MSSSATHRRYECRQCGQTAEAQSMTGRLPLYCPQCRPRAAKRGGGGSGENVTPAYRLALTTTSLRLGIERARAALLAVDLDDRSSNADLRRAIDNALAALTRAEVEHAEEAGRHVLIDVSEDREHAADPSR